MSEEETMYLINSSLQDLSVRDSIVTSYDGRDLPPSTVEDIFSLGCPGGENIYEKPGFVISYNAQNKIVNYVCEMLTCDQINGCYLSRKDYNTFYEDVQIEPSERATNADYKESGRVKAHVAGAANQAYNSKAYPATYCLSNIVPMYSNVNEIINKMEIEARKLVKQGGKAFVCTGPVFDPTREPSYIGNKVRVPDSIFKVVAYMPKDRREKLVRTYEVENSCDIICKDIRDFKKTLSDINERTGLKILCDVDKSEIIEVLYLGNPSRRNRRPGS